MRENTVEQRLRHGVEKLGGRCMKWVSPGNKGVHDRIVLIPGFSPMFVELKAPSGRLSPQQKRFHNWMMNSGFICYVLWNPDEVRTFLYALEAQKAK